MKHSIRLRTFSIACEDQEPSPLATSAKAASELIRGILSTLDADVEHFGVLAINSKGRVTGSKIISTGSPVATMAGAREVYRAALILGAARLIAFHNHPSGDPTPSGDDRGLTRRLISAGILLGVPLDDHLVIGSPDRTYSFLGNEPNLWREVSHD